MLANVAAFVLRYRNIAPNRDDMKFLIQWHIHLAQTSKKFEATLNYNTSIWWAQIPRIVRIEFCHLKCKFVQARRKENRRGICKVRTAICFGVLFHCKALPPTFATSRYEPAFFSMSRMPSPQTGSIINEPHSYWWLNMHQNRDQTISQGPVIP